MFKYKFKINIMKKIILVFMFFVFQANAQSVNDKVQIESGGTWYDGKIEKINEEGTEFYVSYEGWGESFKEWVTLERLKITKKTAKYKVGDRVQVEYGMIPEAATVIEVGENNYHIKYDKDLLGTKWVKESQIKKL